MKEEIIEGNRVTALVTKKHQLWRVVMKANSIEEAQEIIMDACPNATIIHCEEIKPLTQGKLFNP